MPYVISASLLQINCSSFFLVPGLFWPLHSLLSNLLPLLVERNTIPWDSSFLLPCVAIFCGMNFKFYTVYNIQSRLKININHNMLDRVLIFSYEYMWKPISMTHIFTYLSFIFALYFMQTVFLFSSSGVIRVIRCI